MALDLEERDRRYELVRKRMADQGLDALVVVGDAQINQKGFVKYLTNYRSILYNLAVIFPLKGEARFLVPSPLQNYWAGRLSWIPTVDQAPRLGEGLAKNLKEMGLSTATIGLINDSILSAQAHSLLLKELPHAVWSDATPILEELRMIKSAGEQELVWTAATLADLSFRVLAEALRPGRTEREVMADVDRALLAGGAEDIFHLFSARPGNLFPYTFTDRVIEKGDIVVMNTELSGPGGYWVQMVRMSFVGGRPKSGVEAMYDALVGVQSEIESQLRPGRMVGDVAAWVRNKIKESGFDAGVHFGHCLGLDVVERPLVHLDEEMVLRPGMVITVHPQFVSRAEEATVWLGDTYLINENGSEVLTKIEPSEIRITG
jgi:Xaa-Pro aminopeptidase